MLSGFCFSIKNILPAFFSCQKFLIGKVHTKSTQWSRDDNRHNSYRKHDFTTRQSCGEWNRANCSLYGCFWEIGDHAKSSFFCRKICFYGTEQYAERPENQRNENHSNCGKSGFQCIADIHSSTHQNEKNHFRSQPSIAIRRKEHPRTMITFILFLT